MTEKNEKNALSYDDAYKKLRENFIVRLQGSIEAIDNVIAQRQLQPLTREDLLRAQRLVHHLTGTGATFGFPGVSEEARKPDMFLMGILKEMPDKKALDEDNYNKLEEMLISLRQVCQTAVVEEKSRPMTPAAVKAATEKSAEIRGTKNHVLLVDDDEIVLDLVATKLRVNGLRVSMAKDGDTALKLISREKPDLIVLDIMMPGIDGHEVLRSLKQDPALINIPVIMLTAQTHQQDVLKTLHSGAIDYIVKPVDPQKLLKRVLKTLDAQRYTIMLVENDQLILQLMNSKSKEEGYRVILAENGARALQEIPRQLPDLVILDRMLPDMDGIEILKTIRAHETTKRIPVIMLSARGEKNEIEMCLKSGAQEYVVKPFMPDNLLALGLKHMRKAAGGGAKLALDE